MLEVLRTGVDLVAVHSPVRTSANDNDNALMHRFRIPNGRFIEIWSVEE
ncbi:hypothetical protein Poly24_25560 [Rosistilla carotiformis]|uniref:Uncharacterized protein n=1 Tax=Rosistilla carotiformis TaxID=2528017 RepID=A0A518JTH9_9BACT|nr:hypothetical protein Poly24_25560 [Rosistilla carotiformis]